ncbi:hypothetical protein Glove_87g246 [Diversispora epigaea]|uniref:Uncharacterized protein n=1 Tax=Diversispora epigaea TaxID=1348612 RepID=A0A397J661_9GLOM|nr:hypothetical protein Glove_87g246 [Diversispora epigaea]
MLVSLLLTTLVGVSASVILSGYEKYIEIKERKNQKINENLGHDSQQGETFESSPEAATLDVQYETKIKNESKKENDNDKDENNSTQEESIKKVPIIDVTSKTEMLPISKLTGSNIEIKERKNQKINENLGHDSQQGETFESSPEAATLDVQYETKIKNESKKENDNDKDENNSTQEESIKKVPIIDVTSKTEMLPISKLTGSNMSEDERLNSLDDKLDELLSRVKKMREYREQKLQKKYQQ